MEICRDLSLPCTPRRRTRPGGYGIRPYGRGRRPRRPAGVHGAVHIPGGINPSPTHVPGCFTLSQTSRSGQDRSLRTARLPQPVGRGLDPAVAGPAAAGLNHTPPPQTKIPRAYAARGTGKILLPAYSVTPPRRPSGRPRGRCSPTSRPGPRGPCGRRRPAGGRWACAGQGRG